MLGLPSETVRIEEYDPSWKLEFQEEKEVLEEALKKFNVQIEHVGSTSMMGCSAKPIIDIAIGVCRLAYGEKMIPVLCGIGYIYCGDAGIPGRHFFKRCSGELHTHFIHVEPINGRCWNNHILFRDYLTSHPNLIREYSNIKKTLALTYPDHRDLYQEGKQAFIENVISIAKNQKS